MPITKQQLKAIVDTYKANKIVGTNHDAIRAVKKFTKSSSELPVDIEWQLLNIFLKAHPVILDKDKSYYEQNHSTQAWLSILKILCENKSDREVFTHACALEILSNHGLLSLTTHKTILQQPLELSLAVIGLQDNGQEKLLINHWDKLKIKLDPLKFIENLTAIDQLYNLLSTLETNKIIELKKLKVLLLKDSVLQPLLIEGVELQNVLKANLEYVKTNYPSIVSFTELLGEPSISNDNKSLIDNHADPQALWIRLNRFSNDLNLASFNHFAKLAALPASSSTSTISSTSSGSPRATSTDDASLHSRLPKKASRSSSPS